jgi:hypothetical protein
MATSYGKPRTFVRPREEEVPFWAEGCEMDREGLALVPPKKGRPLVFAGRSIHLPWEEVGEFEEETGSRMGLALGAVDKRFRRCGGKGGDLYSPASSGLMEMAEKM